MKSNAGMIRRKKLFINKRFQSHFLFRIFLGVLLSTILLSAVIFFLSTSGTTVIFKEFRLEAVPTSDYILSSLSAGLIISLIVSFVIYFVLGLIYSHQIAGPMYRFGKIFEGMAKGNLRQTAILRQNDEWKETAHLLDQALSSLRERMNNIDKSFSDLKSAVDSGDKALVTSKMKHLKDCLEQVEY